MGADLGDFFDDLDRLRMPPVPLKTRSNAKRQGLRSSSKPRIKGEFLKGPIPLKWLSGAAGLGGKAPLAVALALCFESGRKRSQVVTLTSAILRRFSVNRKAKYRGLEALEDAGLICVERRPKKNPIVTILDGRESVIESLDPGQRFDGVGGKMAG
jgi:DNA-binding transcriptional ArsR family regulator